MYPNSQIHLVFVHLLIFIITHPRLCSHTYLQSDPYQTQTERFRLIEKLDRLEKI